MADGGNIVEEIAAKVNGDIITHSEIERSRRQLEAEFRERGVSLAQLPVAIAEREKDLLRERIDQLLLIQKGKELNIDVEYEVSRYFADLQRTNGIADPERFQQWVRERTGQTFEDFRNDVRNESLIARTLRQEVGGRINTRRSELENYYNEHKAEFVRQEMVFLREIVISTEGKDENGVRAAEKRALDLSARARRGEKFHELARQHSDSRSKNQFGEIGGYARGQLDKMIENIVFAQQRGFVTDPIRIANGFLILRIEEKHKPGLASFEEVENEIAEKLYSNRFQSEIREYLTKLRQEAFLEIKGSYIDSGAAPGKNTAWTDPAQLKPETVTKEQVAEQTRRRRLLWMIPIPGTETYKKTPVSKSN